MLLKNILYVSRKKGKIYQYFKMPLKSKDVINRKIFLTNYALWFLTPIPSHHGMSMFLDKKEWWQKSSSRDHLDQSHLRNNMVLSCLAVRIRFLCLKIINHQLLQTSPSLIMPMLSDVREVKNGFAFPDFCANTLEEKGALLLRTLWNPFSWALLALQMYLQTLIQNSHPGL